MLIQLFSKLKIETQKLLKTFKNFFKMSKNYQIWSRWPRQNNKFKHVSHSLPVSRLSDKTLTEFLFNI